MLEYAGIVFSVDEIKNNLVKTALNSGLNTIGIHALAGKNQPCVEKMIDFIDSRLHTEILTLASNSHVNLEYEVHALNWLLPRDLFHRTPLYFALNKSGKRGPEGNLCVSNNTAIDIVTENAAVLAEKLTSGTHRYYFWQDDVENGFCYCNECSKFLPSDQNLLMMNAILKGIQKVDKKAKVAYLAYNETMEIPKKIEPEAGIFLEFAPIKRRYDVPIYDSDVSENVYHIQKIDNLLNFFGHQDAQVLEYWIDASFFSNWKKPPVKIPFNSKLFEEDLKYYLDKGFSTIKSFGCFFDDDYFKSYGEPPVREYGQVLSKYLR